MGDVCCVMLCSAVRHKKGCIVEEYFANGNDRSGAVTLRNNF